ncbi:MAG TPA: hypothetical protein VIL01_07020 [Thermomicrobiales bacterium]
MPSLANAIFWAVMGAFGVIVMLALAAGLWVYAAVGIVLAAAFAVAGPFVLQRRWRPLPPPPTRRPVRRRRR